MAQEASLKLHAALQRLIALKRQETKQQRDKYAAHEEQADYRDNGPGHHRNPEGFAYTVPWVSSEQSVARHVAPIQRIDRHEINEAPKDIDPEQRCHEQIWDHAANREYCRGHWDHAEQHSHNNLATRGCDSGHDQARQEESSEWPREGDEDFLVRSE